MTEYILIIVLLAVIVYQGITNWIDRRDARDREKDFLNRILAENFSEYVEGAQRLARKPDPPITAKERLKGLDLADKLESSEQDILEVV